MGHFLVSIHLAVEQQQQVLQIIHLNFKLVIAVLEHLLYGTPLTGQEKLLGLLLHFLLIIMIMIWQLWEALMFLMFTPFPSYHNDYDLAIVGSINVPNAGIWDCQLNSHHDGAILGIGDGATKVSE